MCNNCYHIKGRGKKAWKCNHSDKFNYAHGLCQNCYQSQYCKTKKVSGESSTDKVGNSRNSNSENSQNNDLNTEN